METPVLTKKQQKLALSGKKKKVTIKNILTNPYANYWPLLSNEDSITLCNVLEQNLSRLVKKKVNVAWKDIKDIPKAERREFRMKCSNNELNPVEKLSKLETFFAVNQVTRALEKNCVDCLLITDNVSPQLLVKHLIDMSVLRKVPLLIVPNLKGMLLTKAGIASTVFAIKKNASHKGLLEIAATVRTISKNYPVPEDHINFNRRKAIFDELDQSRDNEEEMEEESSFEVSGSSEKSAHADNSVKHNYHLIRKAKSERAFIPLPSKPSDHTEPQTGSMDVIKFGMDDEDVIAMKQPKPYKSLKVKRVRNNDRRIITKTANIKRKR